MAHVRDASQKRKHQLPFPTSAMPTAFRDRLIFLLELFAGPKSKSSRASRRQLT